MPAPLFNDLHKAANNVLDDDYNYDRKLKIKTVSANGVDFTTEGSMSADKAILAKLSSGFSHSCGINVTKLQVSTHGRIIGEANINNALVDGLKFTFKGEDGCSKNPSGDKYKSVGKIGAEYKHDSFTTTVEADVANGGLASSGTFVYDKFVIGAQGAFSIEKSSLMDHNVALSYVGPDFRATLGTKKAFSVVCASFDHKVNNSTTYAAVLQHDTKTQTHGLTVGGRYSPDKQTTLCGKVNSDGLVSLACVQQLKPKVALTTSVHVDAKNIEGEAHKFGLGLTFG